MQINHPWSAVSVSMMVLLAACGSGTGGSGSPESHAATDLVGVVTLELGTADGDEAYVFGRVSGVALNSQGQIYVADAQANEVRVFSPEGTYLHSVGRTGSGPGELRRPCCIAFDTSGHLWVRDGGNARYNVYRTGSDGAQYVGQVRMAHGDVNYAAPLTFDTEGHLIDIGHRTDPATGERRLSRLHLDSAGSVIREEVIEVPGPSELGAHVIERASAQGRSMSFIYPPYGPTHLVAHSPEGSWAEAMTSTYEVSWHGAQGALVRTIRTENVSGPAIDESERTAAEVRLGEQLKAVGAPPGDARFRMPEHKPPLAGLFFDRSGRVWVQRSVAAGEPNEAEVYTGDGIMVARVRWPAGIRLNFGHVLEDRALGLLRDELGVPKVVRLEFMPG